jgi:hypothetical protein
MLRSWLRSATCVAALTGALLGASVIRQPWAHAEDDDGDGAPTAPPASPSAPPPDDGAPDSPGDPPDSPGPAQPGGPLPEPGLIPAAWPAIPPAA